MDDVKLERRGDLAIVTLDRPDRLNAISPGMMAGLREMLEQVAHDADISVVVLQGEGRAFSAGADLKAIRDPKFTREDGMRFTADARAVTALLETMPKPTIAKVHGYCFTGALEIVLAADFIIAAEDAAFADTHALIGRTPAWGLSQRLPRRVGIMCAKAMSMTGRRVSGREAVVIGLALEAVAADELDQRTMEFAQRLASSDRRSVGAYKDLISKTQTLSLDDGLEYESRTRYPRLTARPGTLA